MGNIFGREKVAADVQLAQDARELLPPSEEALDALQSLGQRPPTPATAALSVDVPLSFDLGVQQTPLHSPAFSPLHSPAFSPQQQQRTPAQTPPPFSPVSPHQQQQSPAVHTLSAVETLLSSQVMEMSSYLGNYISAFEEKRKAARVGGGRGGGGGVNSGHPPPISVSSITADDSHQPREALERDFVAALKPLFKEWLELRDDYHDTLAGYLRLPAEEPERLLKRVRHLRKYLREQVPASSASLPERLREFHVWLKVKVVWWKLGCFDHSVSNGLACFCRTKSRRSSRPSSVPIRSDSVQMEVLVVVVALEVVEEEEEVVVVVLKVQSHQDLLSRNLLNSSKLSSRRQVARCTVQRPSPQGQQPQTRREETSD